MHCVVWAKRKVDDFQHIISYFFFVSNEAAMSEGSLAMQQHLKN
jgi:hypothetical protein